MMGRMGRNEIDGAGWDLIMHETIMPLPCVSTRACSPARCCL